jgi:hypothetical protein
VVRRPRDQYPGPAQLDQKIIDSTIPMIPTISRIQPIACRFTPETVAVVANASTAPAAASKSPTPIPIRFSFRQELVL